ncbi:MAG: tetratricopeptide repeat protein [Flavobacteriaceae bacterium]|nr:tetratricopeptide repeat protein [Flavobacteriaceae bacterium]
MANFQTDILFIQALDNYPWDVEQCIEKLQYVLSNENNHAGAHYLLGRIYHEQMCDYKRAREYYNEALSIDHEYTPTYYYYANLLLNTGNYKEAEKVIAVGLQLPDIDVARLLFQKGMLLEKREELKEATKVFKEAKAVALNNDFRSYMDSQIDRIKDKRKVIKKVKDKEKQKELMPLSDGMHSMLY